MKYLILCLILIVSPSFSVATGCEDIEPANDEDCKQYSLTSEEKKPMKDGEFEMTPDSCCYQKEDEMCVLVEKKKVKKYIEYLKDGDDTEINVICSGKFLGLASALLFLVLLI